MRVIVQRFIREALSPEHGWGLIEWCRVRGGDEFSLRLMSLDGASPDAHAQLKSALLPFHRGTPKREKVTAMAAQKPRHAIDTWSLCPDSAAVLRYHIAGGLFTAPSYAATGWVEDFTIYHAGEIMLGLISHEGLVVLRLTKPEISELNIESHETAT